MDVYDGASSCSMLLLIRGEIFNKEELNFHNKLKKQAYLACFFGMSSNSKTFP